MGIWLSDQKLLDRLGTPPPHFMENTQIKAAFFKVILLFSHSRRTFSFLTFLSR